MAEVKMDASEEVTDLNTSSPRPSDSEVEMDPVEMDPVLSELEEDIKELKLFHDQSQRPRVKELLQNDIKKLEMEASTPPVPDSPVAEAASLPEPSPALPAEKKLPLKIVDTYGDLKVTDSIAEAKIDKQDAGATCIPLGKFLIKVTLLGLDQELNVLVKEEHRNALMQHTQVICSGLSKYVKDNGMPKEPLQLDLDSLASQIKLNETPPEAEVTAILPESNPDQTKELLRKLEANINAGCCEDIDAKGYLSRHIWTKANTVKMLELFRSLQSTLDSSKKKYPIWVVIADELNKEFNLSLTAHQCNQRYKNLKMKCRRECEDRERQQSRGEPVGPSSTYHQVMCSILRKEFTESNMEEEYEKFDGEVAVAVMQPASDGENLAELLPLGEDPAHRQCLWTVKEQNKLLELMKKYKEKFGSVRNHLPVWNQIAGELNAVFDGSKDGERCRSKFKNLKKKFMKKWRARKAAQEAGERVEAPDREYRAMFDICSQELSVDVTAATESGETRVAEDAIVQTLKITKAENGTEKTVKMPVTKRVIVDSPKKSTPARKKGKLETIQKVQDMIHASDVRLNETLLQLHAENKKIMEKLIDKL